jgi:hypothetical protein
LSPGLEEEGGEEEVMVLFLGRDIMTGKASGSTVYKQRITRTTRVEDEGD